MGIGQLLYKDGTLADESAEAAQEYLTYSKEHNYVLSPSFTEQMPELKAEKIKKEATVQADAGQLGGREYLGQVYTKVEGEPYILIGNEWQLMVTMLRRAERASAHRIWKQAYPEATSDA